MDLYCTGTWHWDNTGMGPCNGAPRQDTDRTHGAQPWGTKMKYQDGAHLDVELARGDD